LLQSEDIDQTSRRRFLSIIGQEGKRLTNLLNDLLDLSKLASGKAGWAIGPIDLRGVLSFAVNLVTPVAAQKGLILRIAPLSELPPVQGDEERLRQVMSNLLNNAIKFTPSGEIVTGAQLDGRDVTVFVRDSGHGIEPEDREKIFEKFYQVSGDQSGKPKGTGLGLPICREIITHLGGKIWCESAPGEGSTFFFTLQTRVPVKKPFRHSNE
ncbi:MAG: sensor histidine kinase, partial [Nitrospiria bacterium]